MGFLADVVLIVHGAFVLFVAVGALAVLRWPWLGWVHLPAVLWGAGISLAGGICPLTPLENALRRAAGQTEYAGGFIEHYLTAMIYPPGLTRSTQIALGVAAIAFNGAIYLWLWRARKRQKSQAGHHGKRRGQDKAG